MKKNTSADKQEKKTAANSNFKFHISYLKRKVPSRFTLIELLVVKTCF